MIKKISITVTKNYIVHNFWRELMVNVNGIQITQPANNYIVNGLRADNSVKGVVPYKEAHRLKPLGNYIHLF